MPDPDLKKRYWVFSVPTYYPVGGLSDVCFTTDDLSEAIAVSKSDEYNTSPFDSDISVRDYIDV